MHAIIHLFRKMNWVFAALFCAGFVWLAVIQQQQAFVREAEKAQALRDGPPPVAELETFDPARDIHPAHEVNLRAQVNPDYNSHLVEHHKRRSDVERYMMVLFGVGDVADSRVVRAVMVMTKAERDAMIARITDAIGPLEALASQGVVITVNGAATKLPDLKSMAEDALTVVQCQREA